MNDDFETRLRRALRPVEPSDGFAQRVLAALPARAPRLAVVVPLPRAPRASIWKRLSTPVALAASLTIAILLGQQLGLERAQREQRAGLAASRELMEALRVTSRKLDLAYQAVNRPSPAPPPQSQPTEENRS